MNAPARPETFVAVEGLRRRTAAQRIASIAAFAEGLEADLAALSPKSIADSIAGYREAAKRCADYVSEGHHPECHMQLIAMAGRYANSALVFEAALQDRGLA